MTAAARRRNRRDAAPPAPWGKFPLVELCVLIALVIGIWGFATGGHRGGVMLAAAMVLGSLSGLEISIREHFAGYRSHSSLLAGAIAIAVVIAVFFAAPGAHVVLAPVAAAVFGVAFWALRGAFKRRSGGFVVR